MSFDLKTQLQPPIIIVGLARSGLAAQKLLLASGFKESDILTYDERKPEAQYKTEHELENLVHIKTAVISPGVPLQKKFVQQWRQRGVLITSEINLALSGLTNEKLIGITGSLGKSTTTSIIGAGIESFDPNVFVGGNLGTPFCEYALSVHTNPGSRAQWVVLELSSYQLENVAPLKLDYSLITFFSPNHLERYSSLDNYYETKWSILDRTRNPTILNEHGGDLKNFANSRLNRPVIWSSPMDEKIKPLHLETAQLIGRHNLDNLAMAATLGRQCGFPPAYFTTIKTFRGLKHRLENLGEKRNTHFINDSKATTIDSVKAAVEATMESFPSLKITLLLGGRDKKLPWSDLKDFVHNPKLNLIFFGEHGPTIKRTLGSAGLEFKTMKDVLAHLAKTEANETSVVLLSPGGVSQDEFSSFEERGDSFRMWFHRL